MFDQMIVSSTRKHRRNPWAYFISMTIQILVIGVMILVPLLYTEALPTQAFVSWVAAPPPPPPPPPPPAPKVAPRVVKKVSLMEAGKLRAPSKIPERIAIIREEEMPNMPGVVGGVPGGIASGQLGGVIGGVIGSIPAPPPPEQPKRIRVSSGVQEAKKIRQILPLYPPLAKQARIQGVVKLEAIIGKNGMVQNLTVIQGHPLLVQAALDAVQQWRYEPTLLNNEPVEVVTYIDVIFRLN